jgi:hypothetical protein
MVAGWKLDGELKWQMKWKTARGSVRGPSNQLQKISTHGLRCSGWNRPFEGIPELNGRRATAPANSRRTVALKDDVAWGDLDHESKATAPARYSHRSDIKMGGCCGRITLIALRP